MDLVFLLALVEDPFGIAETLTPKDKKRIRRRQELGDRHPAWGSLTPVQRDRARAAFTILCG